MAEDTRKAVRFHTHASFAQRLILSTLTGRTIHISKIRTTAFSPGLAPHEISLLRLLEAVTNGSHIEISVTGTTLLYKPGLIVGSGGSGTAGVISHAGGMLTHEVPGGCERGVSYFLLALAVLAPFAKGQTSVLFTGPGVITSATQTGDVSVDTVRTAMLPLLTQFGIASAGIELRVHKRSNPGPGGKGGGGEVQLVFGAGTQLRLPKTVHLLESGRVKSIRGVAYATGVGGGNNARCIESARSVLNRVCADVYVFSDTGSASLVEGDRKGQKRKIGLGFGLSLVAESTEGSLYSADVASPPEGGVTPEDLGLRCAYQLLEEVEKGGVVPLSAVPMVLTFMAMGSEDVGRVQLGREVLGSEEFVGLARDLSAFGASRWGIREASADGEYIVSIVGKGVGNVGRKIA